MPRYNRKQKIVDAIQLTPDNLREVEVMTEGLMVAKPTNRPKDQPQVHIDSPLGKNPMTGFANYGWYFLMTSDFSRFEVMPATRFEDEYEAVQ